jgi:hypothetical protein
MKKLTLFLLLAFCATAFGLSEFKQYGLDNAVSITTSNTTTYSPPLRAIYVGGAGNITLDTPGGQTNIVFTAVPVGSILWVQAVKVKTATTATLLVGLY